MCRRPNLSKSDHVGNHQTGGVGFQGRRLEMTSPTPDTVLATLTLDELQDLLRFVESSEQRGQMTPGTAEHWRRRLWDWTVFRRTWGAGSSLPLD